MGSFFLTKIIFAGFYSTYSLFLYFWQKRYWKKTSHKWSVELTMGGGEEKPFEGTVFPESKKTRYHSWWILRLSQRGLEWMQKIERGKNLIEEKEKKSESKDIFLYVGFVYTGPVFFFNLTGFMAPFKNKP